MTGGELRNWNAIDCRFPGLLQAAYAGGRTQRMPQDAAPGSEDQVRGSQLTISIRSLACGLARRKHRHNLTAGVGRRKHRGKALLCRANYAVIGFAELVAEPIDMGVIDTRQPPELLVRNKAHSNCGRPAIHTPAVAMTVDAELRVGTQRFHRGQANRIHTGHDARATLGYNMVMALEHLVQIAGDVDGVHSLLSGPLGLIPQHAQDRGSALFEGAVWPIRLKFVILDEVDTGFDQCADLGRSFFGAHPDTWLDDRTDERTILYACETASACDPKLRSLVAIEKRRRQRDVQQFEPGERFQFEEIAGDRGQKIG